MTDVRSWRQNQPISKHFNSVTNMKKYLRPEFEIFEVAVEGGYGDSVALPGFGTENDEFIY